MYTCDIVTFKERIYIKAPAPEDLLQINVTNIKEDNDDWEGFESSRIVYPFDVLYDDSEIRPLERELLERSEMAILAMTSMNRNMNARFDTLTEKYDVFGQRMGRIEEDMHDIKIDIHEMKEAFIKLTDHFVRNDK